MDPGTDVIDQSLDPETDPLHQFLVVWPFCQAQPKLQLAQAGAELALFSPSPPIQVAISFLNSELGTFLYFLYFNTKLIKVLSKIIILLW